MHVVSEGLKMPVIAFKQMGSRKIEDNHCYISGKVIEPEGT